MQPNDNRQLSVTPRNQPQTSGSDDRDRAAAIMREQINRLYEQPSKQPTHTSPQPEESPYDQTLPTGHATSSSQWERYHTAWQQYYQQYYERYYTAQHAKIMSQQITQPALAGPSQAPALDHTLSEHTATEEIKSELRKKIEKHSKKIRKSRHFVPILSALVVMSLFLFLQYNRVFIAQVKSFVSPGSISAQNIILDPTTNANVGPEPRIIIPKINVDAPVVYNVPSLDEPVIQNALKDGVIHYPIPGANANPGEKGNSVLMGHSSNDVFDDGKYKFIFVQLEQMKTGDRFFVHYNGTRYTYAVTATETILPTQVSKLILPGDKPTVTLITCTPVGTAQKRFLVYADQVSPDPSQATAVTTPQTTSAQPGAISGNSPSLFDRLFGF